MSFLYFLEGLRCDFFNTFFSVITLFGEETHEEICEGCKKNNPKKHNGIYCYVMDWETNKKVKFVNLLKGKQDV